MAGTQQAPLESQHGLDVTDISHLRLNQSSNLNISQTRRHLTAAVQL